MSKKEVSKRKDDMVKLSEKFWKNPEATTKNWKIAVHKPQWDIWFVPYTESETGIFGFMPLPDQEMPGNIEFLKDQYQALNQRYDITFPDDIPPPIKKDALKKLKNFYK